MDREAWQATVHGVTKTQTRLSAHTRNHTMCDLLCLASCGSKTNTRDRLVERAVCFISEAGNQRRKWTYVQMLTPHSVCVCVCVSVCVSVCVCVCECLVD